jgi:hypothetical protein
MYNVSLINRRGVMDLTTLSEQYLLKWRNLSADGRQFKIKSEPGFKLDLSGCVESKKWIGDCRCL